jgi:transcriptional regulator GlxA family with amidase domain
MDPRVRKAISSMKENLQRRVSASDLAAELRLSAPYLRQLFKRETGTSLARYLKELRIEEAKRLLEATSLSVKEIAAQVGVGDPSHFAQDFERRHELTPSQYRAHFQRLAENASRLETANHQIG